MKRRYKIPKNFKNKINKQNKLQEFFEITVGGTSFAFTISAVGLENWKAIIWTSISSIIIFLIIYKKKRIANNRKKSWCSDFLETPIYYIGFLSLYSLTLFNWIYYFVGPLFYKILI